MEEFIEVKYVTAHPLGRESERVTVPEGARYAIFSASVDFLIHFFAADDPGPGRDEVLNPTARVVGGLPTIGIRALDQSGLLTIEWL